MVEVVRGLRDSDMFFGNEKDVSTVNPTRNNILPVAAALLGSSTAPRRAARLDNGFFSSIFTKDYCMK